MILSIIIHDIFEMYPNQSKQDLLKSALCVIALALKDEKKIVKKILVASKQDGPFIHDNYYAFYAGGLEANNHQHPIGQQMVDLLRLRNIPEPLSQGLWITAEGNIVGFNVFSLVQHIKGCTDVEAFMCVADFVGINFSAKNVPQHETNDRYVFIRDSHTYPEKMAYHLSNGENELIFNILGHKSKRYIFHNDYGNPSFFMNEWNIDDHDQVRLFRTLQVNKKTSLREWRYIFPPDEYLIYNRHLIDKAKNKEVLIYDQIEKAASPEVNHDLAVATWSGDLSIYSRLDWSFLKDRRVTYIFNKNDQGSIKIGLNLIEDFKQMRTTLNLRCIPPPYNQARTFIPL